jgi:AcrR family transcriptional regulator
VPTKKRSVGTSAGTTTRQGPSTSIGRGAGRPSSPVVSRGTIIETAITLIDKEGLDAFSVRKLARTLNVTSPTIYHHFGDRSDVLAHVVRRLLRDLSQPKPQRNWQEYLMESARAYRQVIVEHPNFAPLLATRPWSRGHALVDEGLRILEDGGVPAHLQLLMLRAIEIIVIGSGVLAGHLDSSIYGDVDEKYAHLRNAIEADRFNESEAFDFICRAMVTGLTATVISSSIS